MFGVYISSLSYLKDIPLLEKVLDSRVGCFLVGLNRLASNTIESIGRFLDRINPSSSDKDSDSSDYSYTLIENSLIIENDMQLQIDDGLTSLTYEGALEWNHNHQEIKLKEQLAGDLPRGTWLKTINFANSLNSQDVVDYSKRENFKSYHNPMRNSKKDISLEGYVNSFAESLKKDKDLTEEDVRLVLDFSTQTIENASVDIFAKQFLLNYNSKNQGNELHVCKKTNVCTAVMHEKTKDKKIITSGTIIFQIYRIDHGQKQVPVCDFKMTSKIDTKEKKYISLSASPIKYYPQTPPQS